MRQRLASRLLYLLDGFGRRRRTRPTDDPPGDALLELDGPAPARPEGLLLWMHAQNAEDAGPLPALAQELSRLRGEPVNALLTASRGRIGPGIRAALTQVAAPGDGAAAVRGFLDRWSPDLGLVLGLPDRPGLVAATHARRIPLYLAFPDRGIAERRLPMLPGSLLHFFDACIAPSGQDARLLRAGMRDQDRVITLGPLFDTALTMPCDEVELSRIAGLLASRPVWLAHRPQPEELAVIEAAHRQAARSAHRLLLIVVPGEGQASDTVRAVFEGEGWRTARRSEGLDPLPDVQVFIADADGDGIAEEEEIWFRIAPIMFCGGTIAGGTASDPFKAAAHGTAIIHGPRTEAEPHRFAKLVAAGASRAIDGGGALGPAVSQLLSPDVAAGLALAGWAVISESAHVIDRMARMMDEALDKADAAGAAAL